MNQTKTTQVEITITTHLLEAIGCGALLRRVILVFQGEGIRVKLLFGRGYALVGVWAFPPFMPPRRLREICPISNYVKVSEPPGWKIM